MKFSNQSLLTIDDDERATPTRMFGQDKLWNRISILQADGQRTTGRIADLTSSSLTLLLNDERKTFSEADIRGIVVRDSVWKPGGLIGLLAGAVPGALYGFDSCKATTPGAFTNCIPGSQFLPAVLFGLVGAAIGSGIDGLIHKTINVSRQGQAGLTLAPVIGRDRQGILASIRF